jgi:glycosyltransferase involved in cell wall biosynthesis
MKVLVVGHALGPGLGSEPGNTWNFASHLSASHEVTLLSHPHHRQRVEEELSSNPRPNLRIHWVTLPEKLDPWHPERSEKGLKLHYLLWQRAAAKLAMQLCREESFDIAHHFSWGTVNAPPRLHRLPVPIVWGPIGGGQALPLAFRRYFQGNLSRELLRHVTLGMLPFAPSLRRMARAASVVLTTNQETRRIVERAGARRVERFLDNGLPPGYTDRSTAARSSSGELKLLWAGRCEPRKALGLGLEALRHVKVPVRLRVAGEGPLLDAWKALARELNVLDRVEFLGRVPWETMSRLFDEADVFFFTSLRDSFGSVVLEAMGHGLPILTLDHQGVRDFVPADGGIKVPVINPEQTARALAEAIDALDGDPARRQTMGQVSLDFARTETWDRRVQRLVSLYEEVAAGRSRPRGVTLLPVDGRAEANPRGADAPGTRLSDAVSGKP